MSSNPWYVLAGFLIVAAVGFLSVSGYTFGFLKLAKKKIDKIFIPLSIITLAWVSLTLVSVMFAAALGVMTFVAVLGVSFLAVSFLLARQILRLDTMQAIYYSVGFSVIINPVWYFLFTG